MAHTGFAQTVRHFNRHDINFNKSIVSEVLPENFRADYPNLIQFLEAYFEHLDSADNFGGVIEELQTIRDIEDAKLEYLDLLFDEIGLGVSQATFTTPREVIRNFGNFFRVKGSEYSIHGFFRAFFNEEVEIIHPKDSLFIVGSSTVGTEDAKKLQDGKLYQVFSTLIKGPIPLLDWAETYRRFVHPAGFYLGAAVVIESEPKVSIGTGTSIPDINPDVNVFSTAKFTLIPEGEVIGALSGPSSLAGLYDGDDSDRINPDANIYAAQGYYTPGYVADSADFALRDRYSLYRNLNDYKTLTITDVEKYYSSLYEWAGFYQSFDDYADSANASAIRFSSTFDDFSARVYFRK